MKSKIAYLVSTIFILQTTLGSMAYAEAPAQTAPAQGQVSAARIAELQKMENERPYSLLLQKEVNLCHGKQQLLESFIEETVDTDADGNVKLDEKTKQPIKIKGKLTENEMSFGERSFDFERLKTEVFTGKHDDQTRACLYTFSQVARNEWQNLFSELSEKYKCGLEFSQAKEETDLIKVEVNASKRTAECDIPYGNMKFGDWLKGQMDSFVAMNNGFEQVIEDAKDQAKKAAGATDKAQTEGKVCNEPGCKPESKEVKDIQYIKKIEERKCCDIISNRWENLGFTTSKDSKPSDKVCYDMINKDNDLNWCESRGCIGDIGSCVKNALAAFAKDFVSSFVDSWNVFGWGSQLWTLIKEVFKNPGEVGKNIAENLFGAEAEYAGCLNKKAMGQYVCQMIGKFFGNSAGFSAGLGSMAGLLLGVTKGVVGKTSLATKGIAKTLAVDKEAKLFKTLAKETVQGAKSGLVAGFIWPYTMTRGATKLVTVPIKAAWNNSGYILSRTKAGTSSLAVLATGKAVQWIGTRVAKSGSEGAKELGVLLEKAGQNRIDLSKKITEAAKQNVPKATSKAAQELELARHALVEVDKVIAMKEPAKAALLKDRRIKYNDSGELVFPKNDTRRNAYQELMSEISNAEKARGEIVKHIDELTKAGSTKTWNNVKGWVYGSAILGNSYKPGDNKTPDALKPGEKPVSPVDGIGTGKTPPPQKQQAPKEALKTSEDAAAPAAAAADAQKQASPPSSNGGVPKAPGSDDE